MSTELLVILAIFIGVTGVIACVGLLLGGSSTNKVEDRLDMLASGRSSRGGGDATEPGIVKDAAFFESSSIVEQLFGRFTDLGLLFEQADVNLDFPRLIFLCSGLAVGGAAICTFSGLHAGFMPLAALTMAVLPFAWLYWRRSSRMKKFGAQLPEAMELMARALRSGQSLPAGFNMVAKELGDPIGKEFARVFEEQNLGVGLEDSLRAMSDRVPNLDLKFFVTAVILQRQTGGDLAEILDKIGRLIRERFQLWGQIQALTGEGRISGIVLLALPFVLFFVLYRLNPTYTMELFNDPMGNQMLAVALFMQFLGAVAIKKIITIKV